MESCNMMGVKYDEYLEENPFFQEIQESYKDILEQVAEENLILCVPRLGTLKKKAITLEDINQHILVPNEDLPDTRYRTYTYKQATVKNNIIILKNDLNCYNSVRILFKETFYVGKLKVRLWCIEYPLNQSFVIHDPSDLTNIISIRDCIHLLCSETGGRKILETISRLVDEFIHGTEDLNSKTNCELQTLVDGLYRSCLDVVLLEGDLQKKANNNSNFLEKVCLSVETYMQNCLQNDLISVICSNTAEDDSELNKKIRNLHDLQLRDLAIHNKFYDSIPSAKCELNGINNFNTVLGKVNCLKRTFSILSNKENQLSLSADDLLQIFVFLIIKASVNNWLANLIFLHQFRFSSLNSTDESSFLIATLEAAVQYIKSGDLFNEVNPRSDHFYMEFESLTEDKATSKNLHKLFGAIHKDNLEEVQKLIHKRNESSNSKNSKICHPLCSCDKCELASKSSDHLTVYSTDDRSRTPLHITCLYGHPDLVEFFVNEGANVNSIDSSGGTPLHYAVLRGYQHAAFLLLHAGADFNVADSEDNTPLHLAANNGHENCVKALIYYSENSLTKINLNCKNRTGNTPLHLAARWGYISIVQVLVQFNALVNIRNKKQQKPIDVAHSIFVKRMLIDAENEQKCALPEQYPQHEPGASEVNTLTDSFVLELGGREKTEHFESKNGHKFGVRPKNISEAKKCELLLKAIEKNDMPLTRFYLGMRPEESSPKLSTETKCHPLCTCETCRSNIEVGEEPLETVKINVNLCNVDGYTALHTAAKFGRLEILRLLLDSGALVTIETYKTRFNVLHIASFYNHLKIIQELLKCGESNFDVQDNYGNTPLHFAAMMNSDKIVEYLLKVGANPHIKNCEGKTPLLEAEDRMNLSVVKVLKMYKQQEYARELLDKYLD